MSCVFLPVSSIVPGDSSGADLFEQIEKNLQVVKNAELLQTGYDQYENTKKISDEIKGIFFSPDYDVTKDDDFLDMDETVISTIKKFASSKEREYKLKLHGIGKYANESSTFENFRFMQTTPLKSQGLKKSLVKSPENPVSLYDCWASSMLNVKVTKSFFHHGEYREYHPVISTGMPCASLIHPDRNKKQSQWSSQYLEGARNNTDVIFRASFAKMIRITKFQINWDLAPTWLQIDYSPDQKLWLTALPKDQTQNIQDYKSLYKGNYRFDQSIVLPQPVYAQQFRFIMSVPLSDNRIAINSVIAYNQKQTVMIQSSEIPDFCVTKSDPTYYQDDGLVNLMDCDKAITIGDGREVFSIDTDFTIKSFIDDQCTTAVNGLITPGNQIRTYNCGTASSKNDNREKWEIRKLGNLPQFQIVSVKDANYCWILNNDVKTDNVALKAQVSASASVNEGVHIPSAVINGNPEIGWISQIGIEDVEFDILFEDLATINHLKIVWNQEPMAFQILFLQENNKYEIFYHAKENTLKFTELNFNYIYIYAIKIKMEKFASAAKQFYEIREISADRNSRALQIAKCDSDIQKTKFQILEVNYVDFSNWGPWIVERLLLIDTTENVLMSIKKLIERRSFLGLVLQDGKKIRSKIKALYDELAELDKQVQQFKPSLEPNKKIEKITAVKPVSNFCLGCAAINPSVSCNKILTMYPFKKSGYYWIQSKCNMKPLRVFCDFESKDIQAYAFLSSTDNSPMKIKRWEQFGEYCAQIGMEPLQINSGEEKVELLLNYINDLGVDLQAAVIPLGVDFDCYEKGCKRKFKQFGGPTTPELTTDLMTRLDRDNILNKDFSINGAMRDGIGLGMSDSKMLLFKIGEFPIMGIICSSNSIPVYAPIRSKQVTCADKVAANPIFDGVKDSHFLVLCPKNCVQETQFEVFGSGIYSAKSSICRAAIHAGIIEDSEGGEVFVNVKSSKSTYEAKGANGVYSKADKGLPNEQSFSLVKVPYDCPQDKYVPQNNNKKKSFLQLEERMSLSEQSVFKQTAEELFENQVNHLSTSFMQTSTGLQSYLERFQTLMDQRKTAKEIKSMSSFIESSKDDKKEKEDKKVEKTAPPPATPAPTEAPVVEVVEVPTPEPVVEQEEEEEKPLIPPPPVKETQDVLTFIEQVFLTDQHNFVREINLIKDAQKLLDLIMKELAPVHKTSDDPALQMVQVQNLNNNIDGTMTFLEEFTSKGLAKRQKLVDDYTEKLLEKLKFSTYEPFSEQYMFPLQNIYDFYDGVNTVGQPSNWEVTSSDTEGHYNALRQTSMRTSQDQLASGIVMKFKNIYDSRVYVDWMIKDEGRSGLLLKFKDQFNYYMMEFSSTGIRFGLMFQGKLEILKELSLTLKMNQWYHIWVETKASDFVVKILQEKVSNEDMIKFDLMEVKFEAEDHLFKSGFVGLFTNGTRTAFFDKFYIEPTECQQKIEAPKEIIFGASDSSRFKENYQGGPLKLRWTVVDPPNDVEGPSNWEVSKNVFGKSKAIYQSSKIYSKTVNKDGSRLVLQDKYFNDGVLTAKFIASNNGFISVLFRYKNNMNFYSLQFKNTGVYLLRTISGQTMEITKDESFKLQKRKWYKVRIWVKDNQVQIWANPEESHDVKLFDQENIDLEEIKKGTIGFETFMTPAGFDDIRIAPIEDYGLELKWSQAANNREDSENGQNGGDDQDDSSSASLGNDEFNGQSQYAQEQSLNEMKYDICLVEEVEERNTYCDNKFPFEPSASKYCQADYCKVCCETEIGDGFEIPKAQCHKACKRIALKSKDSTPWSLCQNSYSPLRSLGHFCETNYLEKQSKINCKVGLCNLCCVTTSEVTGFPVADESLNQCYTQCYNDFSNSRDIALNH